jgi:hypothetical protein
MTIDTRIMSALNEISKEFLGGKKINLVLIKYLDTIDVLKKEFVGRDERWYEKYALARTRVYFENNFS